MTLCDRRTLQTRQLRGGALEQLLVRGEDEDLGSGREDERTGHGVLEHDACGS